jgi:Zn-dependent metalloprotease
MAQCGELIMKRILWIILAIISVFSLVAPYGLQSSGAAQTLPTAREEAIQQLKDSLVRRGHVKRNRATRLADFVRLDRGTAGSLAPSNAGRTRKERSLAFLSQNSRSFGLSNPAEELKLRNEKRELQGGAHLTFNQIYRGIPVFAGVVKTHFNSAGELRAVNGEIVPDIQLSTTPSRSSEEAAAFALAKVQTGSPNASDLSIRGTKLYVFRTGFAQGLDGENHLAWEIEISNDRDTRELVYIDAHSGKFLDQMRGTYDALDRRVYDGQNLPTFPPSFPSTPFWVEGQAFPTGIANADEVIVGARETYDLFKNALSRDSFDDLGSTMFSIFDSGRALGDAQAIPVMHLTVFGSELAIDDVVGHEWTHVYSFYTHNLIYQWQPGALNESYSDIVGETVDLLNSRGLDSPNVQRQVNDCVRPVPTLHVISPAFLQRDYAMGLALFGPPFSPAGISGDIVPVDDGTGVRGDGCQTPFRNATAISGNIALIDGSFGTCVYSDRVKNAQLNGAIAVIATNDVLLGDQLDVMFGIDPTVNIPSGLIGFSDGQALRSPRARTVNGTVTGSDTVDSQRWQIGEQSGFEGFRDMWNPRCYVNPGKVSDQEYFCGTFDQGGVHFNSGIPNHAYALLVDGGTYNNQHISPIGFTKAAHIYLRAMDVYQTPTSDFADHAEALEASAADLEGVNLPDLLTGLPSGQVISQFDPEQVHKATLAVELRQPPTQCRFRPLLAKDPPADTCPSARNVQVNVFADDFEGDPTGKWTISRDVSSSDTFTPRDWLWVNQLPDGRVGSGFFAPDPLDDCTSAPPGEAGVLHLDSPEITLPRMIGGPHLSFDHYVATEAGYDGGQLMVSVNGDPYQLVDSSAFIYNAYNMTLFPVPAGFELQAPRAGQEAFSGVDERSFTKGSWGTSIVDLTRYARSGDRVRLRWDFSTDYCFGTNLGWYVDNVRVYACAP